MNRGRPGCGSLEAVIDILMASAISSLDLVSDQATDANPSQFTSLPPAVHGDDAVQQTGAGTRPLSCLHPFVPTLWTCSVLFQLMSTAGTLARCSEFNEKPSRRRFSFLFSLF